MLLNQELQQDRTRCLQRLTWAIQELGGIVDLNQLEKMTDLIIQMMTGPWRFFHTTEHIFEVGKSGDAIEVIAALFHDLVYVQVDQWVSVNISRYIAPFIQECDRKLQILTAEELPHNLVFTLVTDIFGFKPGQVLQPTAGQNEYLSALTVAQCFEPILPLSTLAEIVACIEATIPFRSPSPAGKSVGDCLFERLAQVNQSFEFGWHHSQMANAVRRAIRVANRDVENFANPIAADFLDNTWNLMPETNHDLTNINSYTVHGFRRSLETMERFMQQLQPQRVFQQYQSEPDDSTYDSILQRTNHNLEVARLYLGCKLLSIGVIEALSLRIGHDTPVATMMGELPHRGRRSLVQLEHYLPSVTAPYPLQTNLEREVLELLEKGRGQASSYDTKNSPVTTFIIKSIGFTEANRLLVKAKAFFQGALSAEDFLGSCDRSILEPITNGVVQVFKSRQVALREPSIVTGQIG